MEHSQVWYLLEIGLFVERQDVGDLVVFHDYAVYHVAYA